MRKYFTILVFLFNFTSHAQIEISENTKVEIDKYLNQKYKLTEEYINIIYNTKDCEKCSYVLYNFLTKSSDAKDIANINVFTDNVAIAKKALKEYNQKFNFFLEKDLFSKYEEVKYKTFYYTIKKDGFNELIHNDSILTKDNIEITRIPLNKILVYDNRIEKAVILDLEKKVSKFEYYDYKIQDTLKLYNLPDRIDTRLLAKTSFKEYHKIQKQNRYAFLKIKSISYNSDSKVFCNFCIDRLYKQKNSLDTYELLSNCFIAELKINSEQDLSKILQVDKYDSYYPADQLVYNDTIYPISVYINDQLEFINPTTFNLKIKRFDQRENKLEFEGLATIEIIDGHLELQNINKEVNDYLKNNSIIYLKNRKYKVDKEFSNEEENKGNIKLIIVD